MGLDPATLALIGQLTSTAVGALTSPDAQEVFSFEGEKFGDASLDPRDLLGGALSGVARLGGRLTELAEEPIQLQTRAQDIPFFFGGDLPMPIGLTGSDPGAPLVPGKTLDDPFGAGGFRNFTPGGQQPEFPIQPNDPFPDRDPTDPTNGHGPGIIPVRQPAPLPGGGGQVDVGDQPGIGGERPELPIMVGNIPGQDPGGGDVVPGEVFQALLAQGGGGDLSDLLTALNVISVTSQQQQRQV